MLLRLGAYIHRRLFPVISIVMNHRSNLLPLACLFVLIVTSLSAHPMGNFSISHYARLQPGASQLELVYALDLAEIPTFELLRDWKLERTSPKAELEAKALEQARAWIANLSLNVNGQEVKPAVQSAQLLIADGAGNLPVLRITARAAARVSPGRITYEDKNYADRAG